MNQRKILQEFEQYRKARLGFAQTIAEMANFPQNLEPLENLGVLNLIDPLLSDPMASIQQTAACALAKLAGKNKNFARKAASENIILNLLRSFDEKNRFFKRAAAIAIKSIAKHSPDLSKSVIKCGAIDALITGLEEFDTNVKEACASAVAAIARHNEELALLTAEAGVIPLLVLSLQQKDISLKRVTVSALGEIAKHSIELGQLVADAGAISHLAECVLSSDVQLKRNVLNTLSAIAKHSVELAELVVEAEIFPSVLANLKDKDNVVKKNCATLISDIVKQSTELSQIVVNSGGLVALTNFVTTEMDWVMLPGIVVLGYIAVHTENLAMAVIDAGGLSAIKTILENNAKEDTLIACAWSIGHIGKHNPHHANSVASLDLLRILLNYYLDERRSEAVRTQIKKSFKLVVQKCTKIDELAVLMQNAPTELLKYMLAQFSKILPHDSNTRQRFVISGALKRVQELKNIVNDEIMEYIETINTCFPEEVVSYYSPGYVDTLIERVTTYEVPI